MLQVLSALALLVAAAGCATPAAEKPFLQAARERPDSAAYIEGVPRCADVDSRDELACMSSVLQYWGHPVSPSRLKAWRAQRSMEMPAQELPVRLSWENGLWFSASYASPEKLKARLRSRIPVIALLQKDAFKPETQRRVLVIGFDDREQKILFRDPSRTPQVLSERDFAAQWRANRNWMMFAAPPDRLDLPMDPRELADRARYFEFAKDYDKAAADYRAAVDAGFGQTALFVRLGNTYRNLGRREDAEGTYRKAMAADPQNGQAYNNLAYLLAEHGEKLEEAEALARQALVLEPTNPLALDTLGFVLYQREKYKEAADVFERARARAKWFSKPTQTEIGVHLVRTHLKNGDIHLAREVMRDLYRIDSSFEPPEDLKGVLD